MIFHVISIFPEILKPYFQEGVLGRALKKGVFQIKTYNLRDWSGNKHRQVDDTPYGGGAGMVMMVEPIYKAVKEIKEKSNGKTRVVLLSARGKKFTQAKARIFSKLDNVIFICGRYEGVDERVKEFIDEEISIGNYVLTGGELGAMVVIDSCARLLEGVLGNQDSLKLESHSKVGFLEYPQYTKPEIVEINNKKYSVPKVLFSGNHQEIKKWREKY